MTVGPTLSIIRSVYPAAVVSLLASILASQYIRSSLTSVLCSEERQLGPN